MGTLTWGYQMKENTLRIRSYYCSYLVGVTIDTELRVFRHASPRFGIQVEAHQIEEKEGKYRRSQEW